jgi:RluA family pseudouridine synthase
VLSILLKNDDFIAVDKPSGMSVHNHEDPKNLLTEITAQFPGQKFFPVHRLDKETSGIQILALNDQSASRLAKEFESRSVAKFYSGILRGLLKTAEGTWNSPLTDKAEGRGSPQGSLRDRVTCETRFTVARSSKYFSLCEFQLLTGRQHQIRKHAALANHAIVGDDRYGDPKYNHRMAEIYKTGRMFLHAARLEIAGFKLESPVPAEFALLLSLPV